MAASNACWGIEVGAGALKALKLEVAEDGVNVLEFAIIPHSKVLSTPGIDQADAIRVAIGTLTSQYDLSKSSVAVSVPGHAAFARFAKLPPVEPKKVPAIVKFEAVQQIPFPLDQVEWDYQTFVSPDSPDVEVGIFAITRERIMERLSTLQDVGITPDYVTLSPVAAYNALAYDLAFTDKTPGTVLLDIGTTSTDVVIADAGRVWVRTFPIGGHQFTQALVDTFKLSYPKAEKLKREAEGGANSRHVAQAMRSVFSDLAQDVQRSIGYYQSLHKDARLTRLIGIGSTFHLPGLRKFLKQQLSTSAGTMDVYRIEEFKRVKYAGLGEGPRAEELKTQAMSMVTCYGLALQGLGLNAIDANLMPVAVLRESMWKGKVKWFAAAAGLGVAASAAMFIRPLQDNFAVQAASPAPIIQTAVREANELKGKATEAQVIGSPETDLRAMNMMALLDNKSMHAFVLDDLGQMFAASDERAKTWASEPDRTPAAAPGAKSPVPAPAPAAGQPAFELKSFQTTYLFNGVSTEGDGGGGGGGKGASAPVPVAEGDAEANAGRRIRCNLRVTTTQPDARRFMFETIDKWLRANKERPNRPYKIVFSEPPWTVVSEGGAPAGPAPAQAQAERPDPRRGVMSEREGGGGKGPGMPVGEGGGGALSTGPAGQSGSLPSLDSLKPTPVSGQRVSTFDITWTCVVVEPTKEGAGS